VRPSSSPSPSLSSPLSPWPSSSSSPLATVVVARPRDPAEVARRDEMLQRDARRRAVPSASRRPCLKQTREVSNRRRRDQRGDRWPASRAPLVYFRIEAVARGEHVAVAVGVIVVVIENAPEPRNPISTGPSSRRPRFRLLALGSVTRLTLRERAPFDNQL